ncbi:MAG: AsmA family protein [Nitrospirales bacterium]|nr:AsmA family protein [Nitrospirales bacterium]
MKKKLAIGAGLFLGVLLCLLVFLPYLVDLNAYRDQYLPVVEQALGRKVKIGDIRLTIIPRLGFQLQDVAIADDSDFSPTHFLTIPTLTVTVQWIPLLHRRIQVGGLLIQDPTLRVIRSTEGRLNISTLAPSGADSKPPSSQDGVRNILLSVFGMFAVEKLEMTGGTLEFEDYLSGSDRSISIERMEFSTKEVQIGHVATFRGKGLLLPHRMLLGVNGTFGPIGEDLDLPKIMVEIQAGIVKIALSGQVIKGWLDLDVNVPRVTTDDFPFFPNMKKPVLVNRFFAHVHSPVLANASGSFQEETVIDPLDLDLQLGSSHLAITGKGTLAHLRIKGQSPSVASRDFPMELPLREPFAIQQLHVDVDVKGLLVEISRLRGKVFDGNLSALGSWNGTRAIPMISSRGELINFSVESLSRSVSPPSFSVTGNGDFRWNIKATVPSSELPRFEGYLRLRLQEGRFAGLDLVRELENGLGMEGQLGPITGYTGYHSILSEGAFIENGLSLDPIVVDGHSFGSRGSGIIGLDHSIEIAGELSLAQPISEKIVQKFSMARVALREKNLVIPYEVYGTMEHPSLGLDFGALGNQVKQAVGEAVENVLKQNEGEMQKILKQGEDFLRKLFGQ